MHEARITALETFLANAGWQDAARAQLAGDASARQYFRLTRGAESVVLMDAPPDQVDRNPAFLKRGAYLRAQGLSVPEIIASDMRYGFILMEDFGDGIFARHMIERDPTPLYEAAVNVLLHLARAPVPDDLKPVPAKTLAEMIEPCFSWYADRLGSRVPHEVAKTLTACLETTLHELPLDRPVFCLRDYHAENLIWLPERCGLRRVGLLDFQDAIVTHPAYDLVSLLQDARRTVEPDVGDAMIRRYIQKSGVNKDTFLAAYAALGLQRNLRILGILSRLAIRDPKPEYRNLIPRVWGYVMTNLEHPSLRRLGPDFLSVLPAPNPAVLQQTRYDVS